MRTQSITALVAAAIIAAGCITFDGAATAPPAPSAPPATPAPSLVPVVTPAPTEIVTLEPGATPSFDIGSLLNAEISVFNLSDADLTVAAVIHDPSGEGEDVPIAAFTLGPDQVTTRSVIGGNEDSGPVPYLMQFTYSGGSTAGGPCTVSVIAGQEFTFVAVNEGVTVGRGEEVPATLDEALIATSSLCVAPPAPTETP